MKLATISVCADLAVCSAAAPASAQAGSKPATSAAMEKYGSVHFPVSCTPAAQEQFDRAVAMLHSFFFPETIKAFSKVAEIDPNCGFWVPMFTPG